MFNAVLNLDFLSSRNFSSRLLLIFIIHWQWRLFVDSYKGVMSFAWVHVNSAYMRHSSKHICWLECLLLVCSACSSRREFIVSSKNLNRTYTWCEETPYKLYCSETLQQEILDLTHPYIGWIKNLFCNYYTFQLISDMWFSFSSCMGTHVYRNFLTWRPRCLLNISTSIEAAYPRQGA